MGLVGGATLLLVAGRSDRPTALRWQRRIVRGAGVLALVAVAAALVAIAHQTAVVAGRHAAALEPKSILAVLLDTHAGRLWLGRLGLLALVAAFVALTPRATSGPDWLAAGAELSLLGALALGLLAAAGHAAAVAPDATAAVALDALHVLATGVWIGGLVPLALLLRAARDERGADARPYAVLAARRFSRAALVCLVALAATGLFNAAVHVGGVPALLGTTYGRLLLIKLALVAPMLALGRVNRRRWIPRLSGEAVTVGRPAMRGLGRFVAAEAGLAAALLLVVSAMTLTPPGRHADPTWPLSFRLTLAPLDGAPDLRMRALVGGQAIVLGLVGLLSAALLRGRGLVLGVGALTVLAFGAGLALPPITVDAYPTTYRRPAVTYQAASIVEGAALYRIHCASCHGPTGAGDGPAGAGLPRHPADLRAPHTAQHTAGDMFWWITSGIPAAGMPAFGGLLGEDQRWHLINFVRALGAGQEARRLGPVVTAPELVAPDFSFAIGPTPPHALRDYRGRRIVVLVLYELPAARPRLVELARDYDALVRQGVEIVAVPRDAAPDAIRRLGADPPVLFPVVTDGAREIVAAYDLIVPPPHAELLVDRAGYLRARWTTPPDLAGLRTAVDRLNAEPRTAAAADEHAH